MKTGCNGAYYKTKQPAHEMTNVQAAFYIQAACTLSAYYNRFFLYLSKSISQLSAIAAFFHCRCR